MKEILERTGLTDRAVRLYIDSGLLQPRSESSYTGRRSIRFSEEDAVALETIATLRKANFSISDIREMQISPERIPAILDAHKERLAEDIEAKQRILESLERIDRTVSMDYTEVVAILRRSASENHVPKEDFGMHFKDIQEIIKRRVPSVVAFALMLMGAVSVIPLLIQAAFAKTEILTGGGYINTYFFTAERFFENIQLIGSGLAMIAAAVVLFLHILRGNRGLAVAGGALCVLSVVLLLFLPAEIREVLYRFEFIRYRYSFMHAVFYDTSESFDVFIQSLKFVPSVAAAVLSFVGACRQKNEHFAD